MTEYQVTSWRDLPSLVVARDGAAVTKAPLPSRFQEAIDEAAMRLGDISSSAYLEGWVRSEWRSADGSPAEVAERIAADLDQHWSADDLADYLDGLG